MLLVVSTFLVLPTVVTAFEGGLALVTVLVWDLGGTVVAQIAPDAG